MMSATVHETKAQRVERLKGEKNAWERLDEIREFARKGYDSIPAEWLGTYFRPWGVYTQGDGAGATGGKGGEGKALPFFMVRIRVPNGLLTSHQVRTIADSVERYARGVADLTVRQNVQLHWVTIESLPELLEKLWRAGLTTMGSCGDDTRNITGCPLAGIDADEICDASPLVAQATNLLVGNPAFYNLPRKFKICITGCRVWCSYPEVNDVGMTAVTRTRNGHPEVGFSLRVGGGCRRPNAAAGPRRWPPPPRPARPPAGSGISWPHWTDSRRSDPQIGRDRGQQRHDPLRSLHHQVGLGRDRQGLGAGAGHGTTPDAFRAQGTYGGEGGQVAEIIAAEHDRIRGAFPGQAGQRDALVHARRSQLDDHPARFGRQSQPGGQVVQRAAEQPQRGFRVGRAAGMHGQRVPLVLDPGAVGGACRSDRARSLRLAALAGR